MTTYISLDAILAFMAKRNANRQHISQEFAVGLQLGLDGAQPAAAFPANISPDNGVVVAGHTPTGDPAAFNQIVQRGGEVASFDRIIAFIHKKRAYPDRFGPQSPSAKSA